MEHIVFNVNSACSWEARSWFYYYKVRKDEPELYVPVDERPSTLQPDEPCIIWFLLDGALVAAAPLLRVQEDPVNDCFELWYDGTKLRELTPEQAKKTHGDELWNEINATGT